MQISDDDLLRLQRLSITAECFKECQKFKVKEIVISRITSILGQTTTPVGSHLDAGASLSKCI
jgi:predicted amidohydrolase YtcJ